MKYLVKFWSTENTTVGTPNKKTGRMSIACDVEVHNNQKIGINSNRTYDKIVSKKQLRRYFLGYTFEEFKYHVKIFIERSF